MPSARHFPVQPAHQLGEAEFVPPSSTVFFIDILQYHGEASHNRENIFGDSNRCFLWAVPALVSVFCCPVLTGGWAQHGWGHCLGPSRLQSSDGSMGAFPSPRGWWQVAEPCVVEEALGSWRLPHFLMASRSGLGVFHVVTFMAQCGIRMFNHKESIPGRCLQCRARGPSDQQDSQGCGGPHLQATSSGRQAAVQRDREDLVALASGAGG